MRENAAIVTVDVEEWFHGHNYLHQVPPDTWHAQETRVEKGMDAFSGAEPPLGMLFAALASGLWIINSLYSIGYMRGNKEQNQTRFYICFALAIAGAGEPVEWALVMARFDQSDLLSAVAARGELDTALAERVADAIAAYHEGSPCVTDILAPARAAVEAGADLLLVECSGDEAHPAPGHLTAPEAGCAAA